MGSETASALRQMNGLLSEILEELRGQFNCLTKICAFLEKWDSLWEQQVFEQWPYPRWPEARDGKPLVARPDYSPLGTGEVVCMIDCPQCHGRIRVDFGDEALMESAFMHAPKDPQTGGQI